jgi:hypothetical protein
MKYADTKLGDEVILIRSDIECPCVIIAKYRNENDTPLSLVGWVKKPLFYVNLTGHCLNVKLPHRLVTLPNINDYQYSYWVGDNNDCRLVFNDPTQKCIGCSIPLPHKKFKTKDKMICVSCKVLGEL